MLYKWYVFTNYMLYKRYTIYVARQVEFEKGYKFLIHFNHLPSNMTAHIQDYVGSMAVMTSNAIPLYLRQEILLLPNQT